MDVDDTAEVEPDAVRLELGVGRGEDRDDEVEEDEHADEEVEGQEEVPQEALRLHRLEGEVAQHPGEERDEGVLEGRELGEGEEDHADTGEGEENESEEDEEVEDVVRHAAEDLEERADDAVETQQVQHLHPQSSAEGSVRVGLVDGEGGVPNEVEVLLVGVAGREESGLELGDDEDIGEEDSEVEGVFEERKGPASESDEPGVEEDLERKEESEGLEDEEVGSHE